MAKNKPFLTENPIQMAVKWRAVEIFLFRKNSFQTLSKFSGVLKQRNFQTLTLDPPPPIFENIIDIHNKIHVTAGHKGFLHLSQELFANFQSNL